MSILLSSGEQPADGSPGSRGRWTESQTGAGEQREDTVSY